MGCVFQALERALTAHVRLDPKAEIARTQQGMQLVLLAGIAPPATMTEDLHLRAPTTAASVPGGRSLRTRLPGAAGRPTSGQTHARSEQNSPAIPRCANDENT